MEYNFQRLLDAVRDGDQDLTVSLTKEGLNNRIPAVDILKRGLIPGVQSLSQLFKSGEVFLPEILISVRAMNYGLEIIKPQLSTSEISGRGIVVLGTVEGDVHDLGKNLVGMMLKTNGFNVVDLGVDVTARSFINAVRENSANIVAMSGLLTTTITYFTTVIKSLEKEGLRDWVKIIIGGAPVTREYADEIGAEGFAEDCVSAVDEVNRLIRF